MYAGNIDHILYKYLICKKNLGAAPYSVQCVGDNYTIPDICASEYSNISLDTIPLDNLN